MEKVFHSGGCTSHLPHEVKDLRGYPLHILIAAWGLRQRQVLTTQLVSRVFFITHSQARDVLYYIRHDSAGRIRSESVPLKDRGHPFCKGLRILSVEPGQVPAPDKRRPVDVTVPKSNAVKPERISGPENTLRALRQWLLSRRPGEPVPPGLLKDHHNHCPRACSGEDCAEREMSVV